MPIIPTIVVAAAVALDDRRSASGSCSARSWKEGLLAQYAAGREAAADRLADGRRCSDDQLPLFRHATGICLRAVGQRAVAGENRAGEPGFVHIVDCATGAEGPG